MKHPRDAGWCPIPPEGTTRSPLAALVPDLSGAVTARTQQEP